MELGSVDFDEKVGMKDVLERSNRFMERENGMVVSQVNILFEDCFSELRDLESDGFKGLADCLNKYFDGVKKSAVLVRDMKSEFKVQFVDLVTEQILVLGRAVVRTGTDQMFIDRIGVPPDMLTSDLVSKFVGDMVVSEEQEEDAFNEDTLTGAIAYQEGYIDPERRREQLRQSLHDLLRPDAPNVEDEELPLFSGIDDSCRPSAVDIQAEKVQSGGGLQSRLATVRWKLAAVVGLVGIGCGIAGSVYAVGGAAGRKKELMRVETKQEPLRKEVVGVSSEADLGKEQPSWICRVDTNSKVYSDYFDRIKGGSPTFVANFKRTVDETLVSGWSQDKARKPLTLMVLSNLKEGSDDKLTREFSDVHYARILNYSGGEWQSGARQTEMFYSAMTPQCELK